MIRLKSFYLREQAPDSLIVGAFGKVRNVQCRLPSKVHRDFFTVNALLVLGQSGGDAFLAELSAEYMNEDTDPHTRSLNSTVATTALGNLVSLISRMPPH